MTSSNYSVNPNSIPPQTNLLQMITVSDHIQLARGDFFETMPVGGDAYMLKHILRNWGDEQAIAILKNCYQAMEEQGRLLAIEMIIPPGDEPFFGKFLGSLRSTQLLGVVLGLGTKPNLVS